MFDKVNHVIKDHPYRNLALKLKMSHQRPRILGLTASLTYAVGGQKVRKSVHRLCKEITKRIGHADEDELLADGYLGAARRTSEVILLEQITRPGVVPPASRKPHLMHATFFDRIKKDEATPFGIELVSVIEMMEGDVRCISADFASPLTKASLKSWRGYAKKRAKECNHPRLSVAGALV